MRLRHAKSLYVAWAVVASGCQAASSSPVTTPSGADGYEVTCVKTEDAEYCAEEARSRCSAGYRVEQRNDYWRQNAGQGTGGQLMLRWIIHCR